MRKIGPALFLLLVAIGAPYAREHVPKQSPDTLQIAPDAVNQAVLTEPAALESLSPALTIKLQVMLDRAHFSPGEIDARMGENTIKAFAAFKRESGFPQDRRATPEIWAKLLDLGQSAGAAIEARSLLNEGRSGRGKGASGAENGPGELNAAVIAVSITREDVKGPFVSSIPARMEDKARLSRLSYTSPLEGLGERYHSSPKLLRALNSGVSFDEAGQKIWVPNIHSKPPAGALSSISVDKRWATVTAYGEQGRVLAVYPATAGSAEKPSLSGQTQVERAVRDPWYIFDPRVLHFRDVKTRRILKIAPGPNNPVGLVWIALAKGVGYGIHGSAEPDKVSKTASHGCIRLTNWDALELASMAKRGTPVMFIGGEDNAGGKGAGRRSRRAAAWRN